MAVQFGTWNWEGQPPAPDYVERVGATLVPYGPDSDEAYAKGGIKILYRAFHTTKESHRETQPHITASGAVLTWDGRLDNRGELISELPDVLAISSTDVEIVAATYEKWGTNCFGKLIGDWALSIWNPNTRSLLLAKDPIGTRHLHYSIDKDHVTWCTILDPLVRFAERTLSIREEYIAGWFSCQFPAAHLTPYIGIHSVPPSTYVLLRPGKQTVSKYWDFDPEKRIRYRSDAEYEEHFRLVFAKAVQRRLRSDRPVLAELSGGMDSSSIVCMADTIIAHGIAETPRLDTISYYDDSEPEWDERPYFNKVEQKRGRTGYHFDLSAKKNRVKMDDSKKSSFFEFKSDRLAALPYHDLISPDIFEDYRQYMRSQGYRVTVCGSGGEEATGGFVPTPRPELQNLLARGHFFKLGHQVSAWAAKMRKPWYRLLWQAVYGFFTHSLAGIGVPVPAPWFSPGFVRRNRAALSGYSSRVSLFGPLPSFQLHIHELNHIRRCFAVWGPDSEWVRDERYPYLDREMLEFVYAIPREQLVGVGKRRFLMKRALRGIVPTEILNRKQMAAVAQGPRENSSTAWPTLAETGHRIISSSLGIIDGIRLLDALQNARKNEDVDIDGLKRALILEFWLHHLSAQRVLSNSTLTERLQCPPSLGAQELGPNASGRKFS